MTRGIRMWRVFAVAGAGLLASVSLVSVASGDQGRSGEESGSESTSGRLELVLDSSGSMKEPAAGGKSKIQAARAALHKVVNGLPEDAQVGMRVYGAEVFSAKKPGACTDSQQVVDVDSGNTDALHKQINAYKPYGETPIGYALQQAGKDLGAKGKRSIVLVSDGEDTCAPPDPCKVARKLAKNGINMSIDVVGLDVSGKARRQLQCIAKAGGGTYYDADKAGDLAGALEKTSTRAFRPFALDGKSVSGYATTDMGHLEGIGAKSPQIGAGTYRDTTPGNDETKNYVLKRTMPGSTFHVGLVAAQGEKSGYLEARLWPQSEADTGGSCRHPDLTPGENLGWSLFATNSDSDIGDECETADELTLSVTVGDQVADDIPMQLIVIEEPPTAGNTENLPGPADDGMANGGKWSRMATASETKKLVPGTGFADAPEVTDGGYDMTILPGETQVIKTRLDWGQRLQSQVLWGNMPTEAIGGFELETHVLGPTHADASTQTDYAGASGNIGGPAYQDWKRTAPPRASSDPVRYRNRETDSDRSIASTIPGYYYVLVHAKPDGGKSYAVPYTLQTKTFGKAGEGVPKYADGAEFNGDDSAKQTDPSEESDNDNSDSSKSDDTADSDATEGGLSATTVTAIAAGAALLVVAGIGGAYLLLRRR